MTTQNERLREALLHTSLLAYPTKTKHEIIEEIDRLFPKDGVEQKAVEFVQDFVKYGFRIDTNPTRMWMGNTHDMSIQAGEYEWWHSYVSDAEKRLLDAAREVLK